MKTPPAYDPRLWRCSYRLLWWRCRKSAVFYGGQCIWHEMVAARPR